MVTNLSDNIISTGKELLQRLDRAGLSIDAAFWMYSSDSERWRLVFALPAVSQSGPKQFYKLIQSLLKFPDRPISLNDISILDSSAPLIKLFRVAIKTGPGISAIRFTQNFINNVLIEDAFIYRLT